MSLTESKSELSYLYVSDVEDEEEDDINDLTLCSRCYIYNVDIDQSCIDCNKSMDICEYCIDSYSCHSCNKVLCWSCSNYANEICNSCYAKEEEEEKKIRNANECNFKISEKDYSSSTYPIGLKCKKCKLYLPTLTPGSGPIGPIIPRQLSPSRCEGLTMGEYCDKTNPKNKCLNCK
jgi:hypothetical protein